MQDAAATYGHWMHSLSQKTAATHSLSDLEKKIRRCIKCRLWEGAANAVPGEGPADAEVMLIGQNPGTEEDKAGRPFIGRSGKFLDTILRNNGISRRSIFITNVVKHKTPGNRLPLKDEILACSGYIREQMNLIRPAIVVLLGALAREQAPKLEDAEYITTFHPAAAMRFPKIREKFESDFRLLKSKMERRIHTDRTRGPL